MTPKSSYSRINQPFPWHFDPSVYLASRQHLLAKVASDHAQWGHQLAVSGEEFVTLEAWTNGEGRICTVILMASYLNTYRALLTSLLQDMERLGPRTRAPAIAGY